MVSNDEERAAAVDASVAAATDDTLRGVMDDLTPQAEGWISRPQQGSSTLHGAWRASSFRARGLRAEERERGSCRACERGRLAGGRRQCGSAKAVAATTAAADSRVIIFVVVIIIIIIIIIIITIITTTTTTRAARLRGIRTSPSSLGGT